MPTWSRVGDAGQTRADTRRRGRRSLLTTVVPVRRRLDAAVQPCWSEIKGREVGEETASRASYDYAGRVDSLSGVRPEFQPWKAHGCQSPTRPDSLLAGQEGRPLLSASGLKAAAQQGSTCLGRLVSPRLFPYLQYIADHTYIHGILCLSYFHAANRTSYLLENRPLIPLTSLSPSMP